MATTYIYANSLSGSVKYLGDCYTSVDITGLKNIKDQYLVGTQDCQVCQGVPVFPTLPVTPTPSSTPDPSFTPTPTVTPTPTPTPTMTPIP